MIQRAVSVSEASEWSVVKKRPLMQIVSQCFRDNHIYRPPFLLERYLASIGCHLFNLSNYRARVHMDGPYPRNFRKSMAAVAPSGYCKSLYQKYLFHKDGLFHRGSMPCGVRGTFTPESWVGTLVRREDAE